ncbi:MAG: hypothetical protein K1X39_02580 [Thermoflexales bacterium]|nr:hypothetical protein [Thermoflexales bacterium]
MRRAIVLWAACATLALAACRPPLRVVVTEPPPVPTATPTPTTFDAVIRVALGDAGTAEARAGLEAVQAALSAANAGNLCNGRVRVTATALSLPRDAEAPGALNAARDAAFKLAKDDTTWLLITDADNGIVRVLLPELGVAAEQPIPIVGLSASAIGFTKPAEAAEPELYYPIGRPSLLRFAPDEATRAAALATWAVANGVREVAVIEDARRPGATAAVIAALGPLSVTMRGAPTPTMTATITRTNPGLVVYAGERATEAGQLLAGLRAAGYRGAFAGGAALGAPGFEVAAGAAAEGALMAEATSTTVERISQATKLAVTALGKVCADPSREAFRKALMASKDVGGVSLSAMGDVSPLPLRVLRRSSGAWVPVAR